MHSNEYQSLVWSTLRPYYYASTDSHTFKTLQLATIILGLQSKVGALSEQIQHMNDSGDFLDHNHIERFQESLGDIQWYVAVVSRMLGSTLEEVMQKNVSILRNRFPTGVLQNKNTKF